MSRLMLTKHATDRAEERFDLERRDLMDRAREVYERNRRVIDGLGRDIEFKIKSNGMTLVVANGYILTVYPN